MNFPDISHQIEQVASGYRYNKPPDFLLTIQELVARFLRVLNDLLNMFNIHVPGLTDSRMVSNVMQVLLVIGGVVCLVLLVIVIAGRLRQVRLNNDTTKILGSGANILLTAKDWQEESERLASAGQWREACRALYFSFLRLLHEREILQFSATRTNYEYFYALVRKKELAEIFKTLAGLVESAWFGNYTADRDDHERCKQLVTQANGLLDAQKKNI